MTWQEKVANKQKELNKCIPATWQLPEPYIIRLISEHNGRLIEADVAKRCGILDNDEIDITESYSAKELLGKLASGDFKSLQVTTAFCKRAAVAQQLTSCLTEMFFDRGLERARFLDEYLAKEGKTYGPLHGLPISIKDSFCLEGVQSTVGWVSFLDRPPQTHNSATVQMLLDLGAVLYCKTNIPQTMMTGDSENNIFGRTLNPHNTNLTAGGSSGGEGALVAFRGSPLGIGTDIAGSIRIPSLCCGTYGFKPTSGRVPFGGQVSGAMEGLPGIVPSAGPLTNSLSDIEFFMSTLLSASPADYDSTASAVPWLTPAKNTTLTIGILDEDPDYPLHPPVKRAMTEAITALEAAGHKIFHLPATSTKVSEANRLAFQYFITGPGDPYAEHFSGSSAEPPITSVAKASSPMFSGPLPVDPTLEPYRRYDELHKLKKQNDEDWRKLWVQNRLNVVLAPGAQNTAVRHDTFGWPPYTVVWNLLDYPACILPIGKASKALDSEEFVVPDTVQPSYHPEEVDGAPTAIQIITRRFEDEKCLAYARVIEDCIRKK